MLRVVVYEPGTISIGPITSNDDVHERVPPRESRVGKLWYHVDNTYGRSSRTVRT